jgi:hypothetical protein
VAKPANCDHLLIATIVLSVLCALIFLLHVGTYGIKHRPQWFPLFIKRKLHRNGPPPNGDIERIRGPGHELREFRNNIRRSASESLRKPSTEDGFETIPLGDEGSYPMVTMPKPAVAKEPTTVRGIRLAMQKKEAEEEKARAEAEAMGHPLRMHPTKIRAEVTPPGGTQPVWAERV